MWAKLLLDKSDDELDELCAQAQEVADGLPPGVEQEHMESLAEACADLLEDRGVVVPVYALYDEEMLLASWMHATPDEEAVWSRSPVQ